eukprot:PhM_4_TR3194/c0_g1_i1/m.8043
MSSKENLSFTLCGAAFAYKGSSKTRFKDFFKFASSRLGPSATPAQVFSCFCENFADTMGFTETTLFQMFEKSIEKKKEKLQQQGVENSAVGSEASTPTTAQTLSSRTQTPLMEVISTTTFTRTAPQEKITSFMATPPPSPSIHTGTTNKTKESSAERHQEQEQQPKEKEEIVRMVVTPPQNPRPPIPMSPTPAPAASPPPRSPCESTNGSFALTGSFARQAHMQRTMEQALNAQIILEDIHKYVDTVVERYKEEHPTTWGGGGATTPAALDASMRGGAIDFSASLRSNAPGERNLMVCLSIEGSDSHKLFRVDADKITYVELLEIVKRKVATSATTLTGPGRLALSFTDELGEVLDLDDDAALAVFLEQDTKKLKLHAAIVDATAREWLVSTPISDGRLSPSQLSSREALVTPRVDRRNTEPSPSQQIEAHNGAIYACSLSPDGARILSGGRDRKLRVWRSSDWQLLGELSGHRGFILGCNFAPEPALRCVSCADDRLVIIWDCSHTFRSKQIMTGHTDKVYSCAWSHDATLLATGSCDRTVRIWDPVTGLTTRTFDRHNGSVFSVTFSKQSPHFVYAAGDDSSIKMYDLRVSGSVEARSFRGHTATVWKCGLSDSERLLVSSSMDHSARVWDVRSGQNIKTFTHHCAPVHCALITPSEKYVVSCARDKCINITDINTGAPVQILRGHTGTVYHVEFSNKTLVSCSIDGTLRQWEAAMDL